MGVCVCIQVCLMYFCKKVCTGEKILFLGGRESSKNMTQMVNKGDIAGDFRFVIF